MCKDVKHTGCTGCNCQAAPFSDLYTGRTRECACVFFKQDVFVLVRISPGMLLSPTFYIPCRIRRKSKGPNTDEQRSQSLRLRKKKQKHLIEIKSENFKKSPLLKCVNWITEKCKRMSWNYANLFGKR